MHIAANKHSNKRLFAIAINLLSRLVAADMLGSRFLEKKKVVIRSSKNPEQITTFQLALS